MDTKTLVLVLALGNLSLGAALLVFARGRAGHAGVATWAAAKHCQAAGWFALCLRGALPDWLAVGLGGALLFAGFALDAGAQWEAAGRAGWRRAMSAALVLALAVFLPALLFQFAPGALGALIVACFVLAGLAPAALAWRDASPLRRALTLATALAALLVGALGVAAALPGAAGWLPGAVLGALYLVLLANGFGGLLLARERGERALARLEVVDLLTDVPNRRGFYQALAPWMALARRPGMPTALIILNLDHFKRINDGYGHPVGDMVLKSMVDVCKKQLRDSDLMGRLGGAEFAVQLPRTTLDDALMVAERIRAAVESMPVKAERAVIKLTASLGVTTIRAEDSAVSLFQRADDALQQAKRGGRNRVAEAAAGGPLVA